MTVPATVRLFHITAIANLEAICAAGCLLSKNAGAGAGIQYQNIARGGAQPVTTKALLQAVRRNVERFPFDFMFQMTSQEFGGLRSQSVTSKPGRGGRRFAPFAFTEQGVAMLSSVLRSRQAIAMNVAIMRAFVRMRELANSNKEIGIKLDELERRVDRRLADQDNAILDIVRAIRELTSPPGKTKSRPIGFVMPSES